MNQLPESVQRDIVDRLYKLLDKRFDWIERTLTELIHNSFQKRLPQ